MPPMSQFEEEYAQRQITQAHPQGILHLPQPIANEGQHQPRPLYTRNKAAPKVDAHIAGRIMKSEHSMLVNILIGVVGGAVAGALFGLIGINFGGFIGYIICGVAGSCLLITIVRLIKK